MKRSGLILRKELLELVRDKRTLYSAVLGPIFLMWLMLWSIQFVEKSFSEPASLKIHYVQKDGPKSSFIEGLEKEKRFKLIPVESAEKGKKLVESGDARVVLDVREAHQGQSLIIAATYDPDEMKSTVIVNAVEGAAAKIRDAAVKGILDDLAVPEVRRNPVLVERRPIEKKAAGAGAAIAGFLPYLIVIWAFYGAFGVATETVAGEKEKQTLETLLITPTSRSEIALGKFLSLACVSLVSCAVSLISIFALARIMRADALFRQGFTMDPVSIMAMFAVIVPLSAMFAGLLLALSAFAKNVRECQTYLTLLSFLVLTPAVFSQFIGFTDFANAKWISFIPVLNSAMCLRSALLGKLDGMSVGLTVSVSLVLAAASVWLAVRLFNREGILSRT